MITMNRKSLFTFLVVSPLMFGIALTGSAADDPNLKVNIKDKRDVHVSNNRGNKLEEKKQKIRSKSDQNYVGMSVTHSAGDKGPFRLYIGVPQKDGTIIWKDGAYGKLKKDTPTTVAVTLKKADLKNAILDD